MAHSLTRPFRLPLTTRERELLLGFGIEDLDLARRLSLAPRSALSRWRPGGPELVLQGIAVRFSARGGRCLERHRDLLEGLPPELQDAVTPEGRGRVAFLFGEAVLLLDRVDEIATSEESPDLVAYDLIGADASSQAWRICLTLEQVEQPSGGDTNYGVD